MRYLAFDIESATTVRNYSDMCAFGYAIADDDFNLIEEKEITIKPKNVTKFLQEKLGVTMDDFKNAPIFREVYDEIIELFEHKDQMVFAHSAISDLQFLGRECRKNGLRTPTIEVYDTKPIYQRYTGNEKCSLDSTKEWTCAEFENHKASEDARACLLIMKKVFELEGKDNFHKKMKEYKDTIVRTKDADKVLDLEDRRAKSDRLFSRRYQENVRPSGDAAKGFVISFSKNIMNKEPEIVTKVGKAVLMNSGKLAKNLHGSDIQVVTGMVKDYSRVQMMDSCEVVKMTDAEIIKAINKKNLNDEVKRLKKVWNAAKGDRSNI